MHFMLEWMRCGRIPILSLVASTLMRLGAAKNEAGCDCACAQVDGRFFAKTELSNSWFPHMKASMKAIE